jgi:predicted O-methyltransferase YrrM
MQIDQTTAAGQFGISNFPGVIYKVLEHAALDSANYAIEKMNNAMMFLKREDLRKHCCNLIKNKNNVIVAEFGVWQGDSINFFAKELPNASLYGFDSFLGLEENWFNLSKGAFGLNGVQPAVNKNVIIYNGLYENTVPNFIKDAKIENGIDLIHMDSDIYAPTSYVLKSISNFIKSGSIIIFDEYFGYPNWRNHEYKAFQEFALLNSVKYNYIAYSENAVAIEILEK